MRITFSLYTNRSRGASVKLSRAFDCVALYMRESSSKEQQYGGGEFTRKYFAVCLNPRMLYSKLHSPPYCFNSRSTTLNPLTAKDELSHLENLTFL